MIIEDKIIVKNYKCFGNEENGFEKIFPINIIIGKNNSGKSTLIDLVKFMITKYSEFENGGRFNKSPNIYVEHKLTNEEIKRAFPSNRRSSGILEITDYEYGKSFIGSKYTYHFNSGRQTFKSINKEYIDASSNMINLLARVIKSPLESKIFCSISAERDIVPEKSNNEISFSPNGNGATNSIQQIINRVNKDSKLIENILLKELNLILNPDIHFSRILVQLKKDDFWELYFEDINNNSIALSKMGSGVKTILLVLLNLIVKPKIENKSPSSYVFAFEELENNLHPALQRRLYEYINNYCEENSTYFFLTTHSNVVIDTFTSSKNTQLIHVKNDGDKSITTQISSYSETKNILSDLGIKASDILQSNGIIWVEGPSDRNYINKWISLLNPQLKEGLHYSIMFYGGRLLSNLTFDYDWFDKNVIPLLKINKNAFVVIDRDGKNISTKINKTKKRISEEIGNNKTWITKGREIENYLSNETVIKWLKTYNKNIRFTNNTNEKLENIIENSNPNIKLRYNINKTQYSKEICEFIDKNSINNLDLVEKLKMLINEIEKWNN